MIEGNILYIEAVRHLFKHGVVGIVKKMKDLPRFLGNGHLIFMGGQKNTYEAIFLSCIPEKQTFF